MTSRLAVERSFFAEHPGAVFDEALHNLPAGRANILRLEHAVSKLPQFECPLKHYFVDGLYVREIFIPAGCVLVGYIHMQPCITTISKGRILINDGAATKEMSAPMTMTVPPGSKKAGYALEDTIWSDAYLNLDNEQDIDRLEARLTADTHQQYLERTALLEHKS